MNSEIYKSYFETYTSLIPHTDPLRALTDQQPLVEERFGNINEERSMYAYAPGKWTIKEMMQHLIDTERIFCYRALSIARRDPANLPGYDENAYTENADANRRPVSSLIEELFVVRRGSILLFESFTKEMLNATGTFNNNASSAANAGLIIAGHFQHHVNVFNERYAVNA